MRNSQYRQIQASPWRVSKRVANYTISIERQRFYEGHRYHWTICSIDCPDELISWGHAPTQELAEVIAQSAAEKLESGLTQGGRVLHGKISIKGPPRVE